VVQVRYVAGCRVGGKRVLYNLHFTSEGGLWLADLQFVRSCLGFAQIYDAEILLALQIP